MGSDRSSILGKIDDFALPSDSLFSAQWHLRNSGANFGVPGVDLDVTRVWPDYTGRGVTVGIIDDGFDLQHPDLADRFDTSRDYDFASGDDNPQAGPGNYHGTAVAGVIGASANGIGTVGVAFEATLVGLRVAFGANSTLEMFENAMAAMKNFDVVNNSWGFIGAFADDSNASWMQGLIAGLQSAASQGRGGLGTPVVFAAGNSGLQGDNTDYHGLQNSSYTIAVGAITNTGAIASFSTPGATVLVSAPGVSIATTDVSGSGGYVGGDYVAVNGTSFAAPNVAGIIALMLEANPDLGYRDVQEIMAYAARKAGVQPGEWLTNAADNWNGGGLHYSHAYGFGLADAHTAVRLAETWDMQHTYANMLTLSGGQNVRADIPDGTWTEGTINIANDLIVDRVEIDIDISHAVASQLDVYLVSPSGTRSLLADNAPFEDAFPKFTFNSVANWGEHAQGVWHLEVHDRVAGLSGRLNSWSIRLLGDAVSSDNLYVFTDEYAGSRLIADANGGIDTINAASLSGSVFLDLGRGAGSLAGRALALQGHFENLYTGDASDAVAGNAGDNVIKTGRGDDFITASAGHDTVYGGAGFDTYMSYEGFDHAVTVNDAGDVTLTSRASGDSVRLIDVESFSFAGRVFDLHALVGASESPAFASVTYFVHGDAGIARQVSNAAAAHSFLAGELGVGGDGYVLLAERTAGQLTLTNNAGSALDKVSMHLEDGLNITLRGFSEINVVADGAHGTSIDIGGGQRGFIQTGDGDDLVKFLAFLIDSGAPEQDRTLTANTNGGNDRVLITDRSNYLAYDINLGAGDDEFTVTGAISGVVRGGLGNDTFHAGSGRDTFAFDAIDGSNDHIFGFGAGDRLDLSRLIDNSSLQDPIARFIQLTTQEGDTVLSAGGHAIATLHGVSLTDSLQIYIDSGLLVVDDHA